MRTINLPRFLLLFSLCITLSTARGQYVAIPDTNFGKWLDTAGYASCLTGNATIGWKLDTTCTAVLNATSLNLQNLYLGSHATVASLTGIEYFKHLQTLICSNNILTGLPPLPSTLLILHCEDNQLTSLPVLPPQLTTFFCTTNHLTSLPALPNSITEIYCDANQLTSLPALPTALSYFVCEGNQLTSLPTLPAGLSSMWCSHNPITSLPALPSSLRLLNCDYTRITSFPTLPQLQTLSFVHNAVTSMPQLPASLTTLVCSYNPLGTLPATLPLHLNTLQCDSDLLTELPAYMPFLYNLSCTQNPDLSCLPRIYQDSLAYFHIYGTNIHCVPNRVTAVSHDQNLDPATMPLCSPESGCDFYFNISGNVHNDTSTTCVSDSLYPGSDLSHIKVLLRDNNNKIVQQFYTSGSGSYSFKTDSLASYQVSIDTSSLGLNAECPVGGIRRVSLSSLDSIQLNQNFGVSCQGVDYGVNSINGGHFRPAHSHYLRFSVGNLSQIQHGAICTSGTPNPGTVTVTFTGPAEYVSPFAGALAPTSVFGKTVTYTLTDLDSLKPGGIDMITSTDTQAVLGTQVCVTVIVTPTHPDDNPYDDTLTHCYTVTNSNDPNLKGVYPTSVFQNGEWLTYTVEFQNTGNDTAYIVVVKDTLDQNIDASTFQYLASSNKVVIQLFGNAAVFTFPQINLVDSATNPPLSTGWIQYKVKARENLPLGTQVSNTASIYFDNNPAVVTNTTINSVAPPLGIATISEESKIHLYPNPNKGTFTLETSNSINSPYTITDMLGHIITQQNISSDRQTINMSEAADGVYTLMVKGSSPLRFTVVR